MKENTENSIKQQAMLENIAKFGVCPVNATLNIIGGKWKALILYMISVDINRFGKLQRLIPQCSKRMLTAQLRELETDGLIHREVFAQVPPKVIYTLTPLGTTLEPIFNALNNWSIEHILEPKKDKN